MTSALVVGSPGSGRTTFVGLLYTAVVRFGTEEADQFRFTAERESIRRLEAIYGALGAGRFPAGDLLREEEPLRFIFGYRRTVFGRWGRGGRAGAPEFDTVPVHVGAIPAAEVAEIRQHAPVLDEATRRLLRSTVVIALVNSASLLPYGGVPDPLPLVRYDRELAQTLETVSGFLALERRKKARQLHPLFLLTQFDRIRPDVLAALEARSGEPSTWSTPDRERFGERLLDAYLPETAKFLAEGQRTGTVSLPASWFFSRLATEEGGAGGVRIRRRSRLPSAGWEPEYPYEEYRALLLELGNLAHDAPTVAAA